MPVRWTYDGSGGTRYPVEPGQVWQAGRHRLICGDLQTGAAFDLMTRFKPDLVYTDPPWNAGNAASFRTKAQMPGKVDFPAFLHHLVVAINCVRRYAFIEMGRQNAELLERMIVFSGGTVLARWPITYYRHNPCELFCASWTGQPRPECDLKGLDDDVTPFYALEAVRKPGDLVFDPCTGRGLTARTAEKLGLTFLGLELSPWRMSAALSSLADAGCAVTQEA
jgi:hypothetical protein